MRQLVNIFFIYFDFRQLARDIDSDWCERIIIVCKPTFRLPSYTLNCFMGTFQCSKMLFRCFLVFFSTLKTIPEKILNSYNLGDFFLEKVIRLYTELCVNLRTKCAIITFCPKILASITAFKHPNYLNYVKKRQWCVRGLS